MTKFENCKILCYNIIVKRKERKEKKYFSLMMTLVKVNKLDMYNFYIYMTGKEIIKIKKGEVAESRHRERNNMKRMFKASWADKVDRLIEEVSMLGMDYVERCGNTIVFNAFTDGLLYFAEDVKNLLDSLDFVKSYSFTQEDLSDWSELELEGDDNTMDILTVELKEEN